MNEQLELDAIPREKFEPLLKELSILERFNGSMKASYFRKRLEKILGGGKNE